MLLKSRSTSSSLARVLQVFEANRWLMELDLSVLLQLNSWPIGHRAWLLPLRRLMCIQLYKHVAEVVYLWRWHKLYTCALQVAPYERPALSKAYLFPQGISQEKNINFPTTCLQCGLGYWLSSSWSKEKHVQHWKCVCPWYIIIPVPLISIAIVLGSACKAPRISCHCG
jgi:hypothetical protein